jgi:hypothetical protein
MDTNLLHSLAEHRYLRELLKAEFREADEEALRDTLDELRSVPELLAAVLRSYLVDLAFAAALGIRIDDMHKRLSRIEQRADRKRELVTEAMVWAEIKKLIEPDFTASLRAVPAFLSVLDEKQIPADFWEPQPPKLDKLKLSAALNAGAAVPGAVLGKPEINLSVRTR